MDEGAIASITKEEAKDSTSQDLTDGIDVPPEHREMITELLEQNRDLFAKTDAELGHTSIIQMKIDTGNHPPIKMRSYRTPLKKRRFVDQAIDDMLGANIIRRSKSPWTFL